LQLVVALAFAAVVAEPEAEADASLLYANTLPYNVGAYGYYGYPYGNIYLSYYLDSRFQILTSFSGYSSYGYGYPYHLIGKRDAEAVADANAEPEADADADASAFYLPYYGGYG